MQVKAFDKEGDEYLKTVTLIEKDNRQILDFGWPARYYIEDLVEHYPYDHNFCIDMGGRNHKGIPEVCVPKETMNKVLEELAPKFLEHPPDLTG